MIPALRALASLLAADPLTVNEVSDQLGTVTHDFGANVMLAPRDPLFKEASVVRGIDPTTLKPSPTPAHVTLTPAEPPALETLTQAFGPATRVPAEEKIPPQAIFYLEMPGQPYTVALIAEVQQRRVTRITLRRDQRL